MDKKILGSILDANANEKHETTKEDKIVIFAETQLGGIGRNHSLWQLVNSSSIRGASSSGRNHVAIDMPEGWTPATARPGPDRLRLHHLCVSASECVDQLEKVRARIAQFAARNEDISRGQKPIPDFGHLTDLSFQIMNLAREAFVPAHRLCTATIGLYMVEDYIRESGHSEFPDYEEGRIRIPNKRSNRKTLLQLHMCVDSVTELYAKFQTMNPASKRVGALGSNELDEMREVFLMMRHIIHELYSTGAGCFDLLNILIYVEPPEQEAFKDFLNHLNSMEKSDLLEGISKLRRTVDHIPLLLEKLSWASYTVFRLASGTSPGTSPIQSGMGTPDLSASNSKHTLDIPKHKMDQLSAHARSQQGSSRSSRTVDGKPRASRTNDVSRKRSEGRIQPETEPLDEEPRSRQSRSRERLTSSKHDMHSGRSVPPNNPERKNRH